MASTAVVLPQYCAPPSDGSSPISKLPHDLLTRVFDDLYAAAYYPSDRQAAFVCRRWRAVGLDAWERNLTLIYTDDEGAVWRAHVKRTRLAGAKVTVRSLYVQELREVPEELETLQGVRTLVASNYAVDDESLSHLAHSAFSSLDTLVLSNLFSGERSTGAPQPRPKVPAIRRLVLGALQGGEGLPITSILFPTLRELVLHSPHVTSDDVVLSPATTPNLTHLTCPFRASQLFTESTLASPALKTLQVVVAGIEDPRDVVDYLKQWAEMPRWPAFSTLDKFVLVTKRGASLPKAELAALRTGLEAASIRFELVENDCLLVPDCEAPHFSATELAKAPTYGGDMGYDSDDSAEKYIYYARKNGFDGFSDW